MKDYHPDIAAVEMGLNHFNDTLMAHFWRFKKIQAKAVKPGFILQKVRQTPPTYKPPTGQSPKMCRNDDSSPSTSM